MCGIVSLISARVPVDPVRLQRATGALSHRGPDGEGRWFSKDGTAALGHRRLSIIDLATGAQPISNEDGTIHIVVNGEFYGFEDIRRDLRAKGHRFSTASDSEVALHLYEERGIDFVHDLRGEFALILYDENRKRLVAARDRFGIKPLCHAEGPDGTFYAASEAKAIIAAGFPASWDEYAFFHACNVQYVPTDRTLFKGIHQLPPGHLLIVQDGKQELKSYWDLDYPAEPVAGRETDADWIALFGNEFEAAIRLRLRADVPVCCHLSGGLDSSAVAAMSTRIAARPPACFTVSFDAEGYDELPVAREMAERMGAALHVVPVSQDDLVKNIPEAVYYSEGLSINGHLAGKFLLNRAIRAAGFKVTLTGEGADEVLAGYPHLREDMIEQDEALAHRRAGLYQSNDKLAGVFLAHGDTLPLQGVADRLGFVPSFLRAKASLGFRMSGLLSADFAGRMQGHDIYRDVIDAFDVPRQLAGRHVVNQSSYLWTKLTLATYILRTLGDGCEMAHSIEGRLPFLDHKLFELARRMPMTMKIRDLVEKHVLREAVRPLLTETIYKRQKHPFIAPPVSRFSNAALDGFIQDTLRSAAFAAMPFFDARKTRDWLDSLPRQSAQDRVAAEPVLMLLLTSFVIHQKFKL